MRLRIDLVDALKWRVAEPWPKFIVHVILTVFLGLLTLITYLLTRGFAKATGFFLSERNRAWRWSGFIPTVLEEKDTPRGPDIYFSHDPSLCVICEKKPLNLYGLHPECLTVVAKAMQRLEDYDKACFAAGTLICERCSTVIPPTDANVNIGLSIVHERCASKREMAEAAEALALESRLGSQPDRRSA
jgi:hypothetical protein